jgi:hypothetical protein
LFSLLCFSLIEAAIVNENNRLVLTDAFADALEDPSQILELLILYLIQKKAEEIVLEIIRLNVDTSTHIDDYMRLFVGALRIANQLFSNQYILVVAQIVVESRQQTLLSFHIFPKSKLNYSQFYFKLLTHLSQFRMIPVIHYYLMRSNKIMRENDIFKYSGSF